MPMTMKIYVDGNKRRTERDVAGGNVTILRGDLSKRYMLVPGNKTYMEAPLDPRMLESPNDWAKRMGLVHEKVGTEDINGETCDKYQYSPDPKKTANQPTLPNGRGQMTGFIWVGQKTHMLVKSDNAGSTAEWKNIKLGPPDASLFDLPADYKKAEAGRQFPGGPQRANPDAQKPGELKSGGQSPSPQMSASPEASASPESSASPEVPASPEASPSAQKSDGDK
jgi:hypothetical protein